MNRRSFIRSAVAGLVLPVAPAIVRAGSLMPVWVPDWDITAEYTLVGTISVSDYGAKGDGVTDATTVLKEAFDHAIANQQLLVLPAGSYLVSGPIATATVQAGNGSLHILCAGDVTIKIADSASHFGNSPLLYVATFGILNSTIAGGRLTLDLNNKAKIGIQVSNFGKIGDDLFQDFGGVLHWGPITVRNALAASRSNGRAFGIRVQGVYRKIRLVDPIVQGVSRHSSFTASGACVGIFIDGVKGDVVIENPTIENVLTPNQDADGLIIMGLSSVTSLPLAAGDDAPTMGRTIVNHGYFADCQGRSIKLQISDVVINRPKFYRKNVVSIQSGYEVDSQCTGRCEVIEPQALYEKNSGTSPLGTSFGLCAFQMLTDKPMQATLRGGVIHTEVVMPKIVQMIYGASSASSVTAVDGLMVVPRGMSAGASAIGRSIVEFGAGQINSMDPSVHARIVVRNTKIPNDSYIVGYTAYNTKHDISAKLGLEIVDNENFPATTTKRRVFDALSGSAIVNIAQYRIARNMNYRHDLRLAGT
jgi:hypothetical protein